MDVESRILFAIRWRHHFSHQPTGPDTQVESLPTDEKYRTEQNQSFNLQICKYQLILTINMCII